MLPRSLEQAVRYYLTDRDSGRAGWAYPGFLPDDDNAFTPRVRIAIDAEIWDELATEANHQEVAADRLLRHAILYFMADRDTGRLTQRILEDLGAEEA